jgi:uncharacterized protein YndB with AHSA1/START domain
MGKDFEEHLDATVPATPEQVWDAIATGPGISSWFVGRTQIDGTTVRTHFGDDWIPTGTITTSEPPHHFAYRSDTQPDGRFIAYEYLIEGRDHSATVLRTVTSGFIPGNGNDWAGEYEAMQQGGALFFATLVQHLTHFPGRHATPITAFGTDWPAAIKAVTDTLGLDPSPRPGDKTNDGGTVYFTNSQTLGIRTANGFHRYVRGLHDGSLVTMHELFEDTE